MILAGENAQFLQNRLLAAMRREVQCPPELNIARHRRLAQRLQRLETQQREHFTHVGFSGTKMAMNKRVGRIQIFRGGHEVWFVL